MFFLAAIAAGTLASVGSTIGVGVAQQQQTNEAVEDQKKFALANAYVDYGQSLAQLPGAVPTS